MHIVNGPTLMEGRSDNACQTMTIGQKDYIVAPGGTGGTSRSGVQLTSTELLDLSQLNSDESAWIPGENVSVPKKLLVTPRISLKGPELPVANCDFQLVPSSDSSSLYTIGACRSSIWDKVYKMTCPTDVESCIWEEHSSIKTGRGRGSLAIPLTGNMVNKLCYNWLITSTDNQKFNIMFNCFENKSSFIFSSKRTVKYLSRITRSKKDFIQ